MSQFDVGLAVGFIIGLCVGISAVGLMVLRAQERKTNSGIPPARYPPPSDPPSQHGNRENAECLLREGGSKQV